MHRFDLAASRFVTEQATLNQARHEHSAFELKGNLYVVGGYANGYLDSIERKNILAEEAAWSIFTVPFLPKIKCSMIHPINETQVLIAGGSDCQSAYLFDCSEEK